MQKHNLLVYLAFLFMFTLIRLLLSVPYKSVHEELVVLREIMRLYHFFFLLITPALLLVYYFFNGNPTSKRENGIVKLRHPERKNIFFLKTHKCGSSTVQNIILRYGYLRGLSFVLPSEMNYLGHPKTFDQNMIPEELTSLNGKYNIFAHHTRYNYTSIKDVMQNDAAFITILRNPLTQFESLYSYYNLQNHFGGNLQYVLNMFPKNHLASKPRYLGKLGLNQMSFDLGIDELYFNDTNKIRSFVEIINNQFDLVMISEYMEASLILLCDLMNWPLSYVQFITLNKRTPEKRAFLNISEQQAVLEMNLADLFLYRFFLQKLQTKIKEFGIERMIGYVKKLMNLNNNLYRRCVENTDTAGYADTMSYLLKDKSDWLCIYATKNELNFTEEVKYNQKEQTRILGKMLRLTSMAFGEFWSDIKQGF